MDWVNLFGNNVFTEAQLEKRREAHISSEFSGSAIAAMRRKSLGDIKGQRPLTSGEQELEAVYTVWCNAVETDYQQAKLDNELLKGAITYEQAEQRLNCYILSEGREAIVEVPEVIDPETSEIIQEFIPEIKRIEPLPLTVTVTHYDSETGEIVDTQEIPNPLIVADEAARETAQNIINNTDTDCLSLVNQRKLFIKGN